MRCPDCGADADRLPPCRICGYVNGCCLCYHADDVSAAAAPAADPEPGSPPPPSTR